MSDVLDLAKMADALRALADEKAARPVVTLTLDDLRHIHEIVGCVGPCPIGCEERKP